MSDLTGLLQEAREAGREAFDLSLMRFDPEISPAERKARAFDAAITAFLSCLRERGVKLVGREASRAMMLAGQREIRDPCPATDDFGDAWSAMWDAVPDLAGEEGK